MWEVVSTAARSKLGLGGFGDLRPLRPWTADTPDSRTLVLPGTDGTGVQCSGRVMDAFPKTADTDGFTVTADHPGRRWPRRSGYRGGVRDLPVENVTDQYYRERLGRGFTGSLTYDRGSSERRRVDQTPGPVVTDTASRRAPLPLHGRRPMHESTAPGTTGTHHDAANGSTDTRLRHRRRSRSTP